MVFITSLSARVALCKDKHAQSFSNVLKQKVVGIILGKGEERNERPRCDD